MNFTKPWSEYTYIGFDTETSGKYPLVAEIVEIAAVKWRGGQIIDTFETFTRPRLKMSEEIIKIHHITNEMVADAPFIKDVLPKFKEFIQDGILVAHNAAFDMGFLAFEFEKLKMPLPTEVALDSCNLARVAYPNSHNHRLITLVQLLQIPIAHSHRALEDSKACLEVALKSMQTIGPDKSLNEMLTIQGGAFEWSRYSLGDLRGDPLASVIVEASEKSLVLEIVYKGGSRPGEPRRITPHGLVRNPQGDFIVGLCHRENVEKRFYLNRISSAKILD